MDVFHFGVGDGGGRGGCGGEVDDDGEEGVGGVEVGEGGFDVDAVLEENDGCRGGCDEGVKEGGGWRGRGEGFGGD